MEVWSAQRCACGSAIERTEFYARVEKRIGADLILEEHLSVELRYLGVDAFADHFALACVQELAHLYAPRVSQFP